MQKRFPTLYGRSSSGKLLFWDIEARETSGKVCVLTQYGYSDGEIQHSAVYVENGKNIGRSNETTAYQQACLEAESKWNKKKDKKYVENREELDQDQRIFPMLAHNFKKRSHDIVWSAFVQPKLNGIRCLCHKTSEKEIIYLSRGGKQFNTLEHFTPHLLPVMNVNEILDGELFTRELTFQEIVAAVRREKTKNPNIDKIEYWVYDCVQLEATFDERNRHLIGMLPQDGPIVLVPTLEVENEDAMRKAHVKFVQQNYEGTIIRNKLGLYKCKYRSKDLQKFKDFLDEEFTIVGGKEGVGRAKGTITWTCVTEDGKTFDTRPTGTEEQRRYWWENLSKFIGQKLTVRYQNRSDDNIPIFPVGINIRNYE